MQLFKFRCFAVGFIFAIVSSIVFVNAGFSGDNPNIRYQHLEENFPQEIQGQNLLSEVEIDTLIDHLQHGDYTLLYALDEQQMKQLIEVLRILDITLDPEAQNALLAATLPACSGFWGSPEWASVALPYSSYPSGIKYQAGPNCYIPATHGECGPDSDDIMLSFYLGYHNEDINTLKSKLRWYSTSTGVYNYLFIFHLGNTKISSRLYEQTSGGGADNYNIYLCIPGAIKGYWNTMIIRKY